MKQLMKTGRWLLTSIFVFGVVATAAAQIEAQELNDPSIPGSVLVFPYYLRGNVDINGVLHPKTEIEINVTCPTGSLCQEGSRVKLLAHWVCPASQNPSSKFVCRETDFIMQTTVDATVTFNPDNNPPAVGFFNSTAPPQGGVRVAPCREGYLIVWVVDQFDRAIKWDGLVGNATVRPTADAAEGYNAIPIQAVSGLALNAFTDVDGTGDLDFDGETEYKAVTGTIIGSVRYDEPTTAPAPNANAVLTTLILLTLDVRSNRPNAPVFTDLYFYNQFEVPTSTFVEFICWGNFQLSRIDENLTRALQGSRKGYVRSGPATKEDIFGINDPQTGPATLLGIVFTRERGSNGQPERSYSLSLYNDGAAVPTTFEP